MVVPNEVFLPGLVVCQADVLRPHVASSLTCLAVADV